jgi:hypothetical protein
MTEIILNTVAKQQLVTEHQFVASENGLAGYVPG